MSESPAAAGSRALLYVASGVVIVAGLKAASAIITPFLIAVFVATLSLPVLNWLLGRRVPSAVAVLLTLLLVVGVLVGVGLLFATTVNEMSSEVDKYSERFQNLACTSIDWLDEHGVPIAEPLQEPCRPGSDVVADETVSPALLPEDEQDTVGLLGLFDLASVFDLANRTLRVTASALTNLVIIVLITVFILSEAVYFRIKLLEAFGTSSAERRFGSILLQVQRYLGIKTIVSASTGVILGSWVHILDVDFAIFWGFVAFVLNYVPSLGSILAAIPPMLLALIQHGPGTAFLVGLAYLVVNVLIGNFAEPQLMGRRLGLSPLVVFLSLVFWGWVWGPVGMLLSVPLTMILRITFENTDEYRWIAVLLGNGQNLKSRVEAAARARRQKAAASATAAASAEKGQPSSS